MDRMNKEQLIKLIESVKIDKTEFWLLSSSALVMRGVYPDAGDLDIAVTEKGLEQLKQNYNWKLPLKGICEKGERVTIEFFFNTELLLCI